MKLIGFLIFLFNLIAIIISKTMRTINKERSSSKTETLNKGIYYTRGPYFGSYYSLYYRPWYRTYYKRPYLISSKLLVPLSPFNECPEKRGKKSLIGKSSGRCKKSCTPKSCIQITFECCTYGIPEKK